MQQEPFSKRENQWRIEFLVWLEQVLLHNTVYSCLDQKAPRIGFRWELNDQFADAEFDNTNSLKCQLN